MEENTKVSEDKNAVERLKMSLEQKSPALVLGAGFSFGVRTQKGEKFPMAAELTEKIFDYCFRGHKLPAELEEDRRAAMDYKKNGDLKGLCSLIRAEGDERLRLRNSCMTKIFSNCSVEKDSYYFYLTEYKWSHIFTLNIDNLVEYLYRSKMENLAVWSGTNKKYEKNANAPILIKLHGSVDRPEEGYVFDSEEYTTFLTNENCLLHEFGDAFVGGDMIFLGTEFQEQDLWTIIEKYKGQGYDSSGNQYFFITPSINDPVLKRKIDMHKNMYRIPWKTEEFLHFLHTGIIHQRDLRENLKQKGMYFLDELGKEVSSNYSSDLYTGKECTFKDIVNDWDIRHPKVSDLEKDILKHTGTFVVAIYGKTYVGKSCFAKRILVDLQKRGFICFKFDMKSSEYIELFVEYLKMLPTGSEAAVLFESASFYYYLLTSRLLRICPDNIKKLVILTTDTVSNHRSKRAAIGETSKLIEFQLTEEIDKVFAQNIYNKFQEKNWTGRLWEYCDNEKQALSYARKVNDIIDFLYRTSRGKGFESYFEDMFLKKDGSVNKQYLLALCTLEILGVDSIPQRIIPDLLPELKTKFKIKDFLTEYEEILLIDKKGLIKVRCLRLIQHAIKVDMSEQDYLHLLRQVVVQITGQFCEGETNNWTELFQKVLLVRRLLEEHILSVDAILELFWSIEDRCKQYSYYWIQRGIAERKSKQYEKADNSFRIALHIRPHSYQAHHALAKNLMERGVEELQTGTADYAVYYFDEGRSEMEKIIEDKLYSRAYRYSVHAYIDMSIKFAQRSHRCLTDQEAEYILRLLKDMDPNIVDEYMQKITEEFSDYCERNELGKYSDAVRSLRIHKKIYMISDEKDYLVEHLDMFEG